MPPHLEKPNFVPDFPNIVGQLVGKRYVAICGLNNCGKSYLLKLLKKHIGKTAYLVGPARFYHITRLASKMRDETEYVNFENTFNHNVNNSEHNFDQNMIGLDHVIINLTDARREILFEICGKLLGNSFSMKHFEEDNRLSPFYIDMDGQNISIGSSGTRMLMTLIGLCMDQNFNTLLIDEPELGLGPKIQMNVSKFLSDQEQRKKYFPHLTSIIVSTHSQLFLDRRDINNNFSVEKLGNTISVRQVSDFSELHNLQFNLLGNSLESLFLPSAFVFVEGKTDLPYLDKIIKAKASDKNIVVIQSQGNVKGRVHALKESLHDIYKSPFRSRIFAVLDSVVPNPSLRQDLVAMGLLEDNIISWTKNGIEYFYPPSIMASIFNCNESKVEEMMILDDIISLNGIERKKSELSAEVCTKLDGSTTIPQEVSDKLISRILSLV